jgi:hypothetical protein
VYTGGLRDALQTGALVVCDCDGCEREILDPEAVPQLRSRLLIVEAHELLGEGITPTLRARFEPSHHVIGVPSQPRYVDDFPQLGDIPLVTRQLAWRSSVEGRCHGS